METLIAYIDDAAYARHILQPMKNSGSSVHWVLVTCPPRMSRHINKWVHHRARQQWRQRWSQELFDLVRRELLAGGDRATLEISHGCLVDFTAALKQRHGNAPVLDARRPKFGHPVQAVVGGQPSDGTSTLSAHGALAGLGAALVLASE